MTSKTMNFTEWLTACGSSMDHFNTFSPEDKAKSEAAFKADFAAAKHTTTKPAAAPKAATTKKGAKTMKATKKTTAKKSTKTAAAKPATVKAPSSGARIREMILKGMANDAILVVIKKEFKDGKTTTGDVSWNRSMLKAGKFNAPKKVLTNAEAIAKAAK